MFGVLVGDSYFADLLHKVCKYLRGSRTAFMIFNLKVKVKYKTPVYIWCVMPEF